MTFADEPTGTIIGYVPQSQLLATEFKDDRGLIIKDDETILKSGKVTKRPVKEFLTKDDENIYQYRVPDKVATNSTKGKSTCCFFPFLKHSISRTYLLFLQVLLKHGHAFDIIKPSSQRSCCFTKGKPYAHHYVLHNYVVQGV